MLVFVVTHLVNTHLDNPNGTQPPNHNRGRNRGPNVDIQLPAPPSQILPQVSVDTALSSGMLERTPKNRKPSTRVPQQPRGVDPVHETTPRHNLDSIARMTLDDLKLSPNLAHLEDPSSADEYCRVPIWLLQGVLKLDGSNREKAEDSVDSELEIHGAAACVICLGEFNDRWMIRRLDCGHEYQSHCISKWLRLENQCPICKSQALPLNRDHRSAK